MADGGAVINISSQASTHPTPHTVVYAAAKAGLNALTKAAARELAPKGIRVNCIVCGMFDTDSFRAGVPSDDVVAALGAGLPAGRIGQPDDIVGTALYLATDASAYLTGQLIHLDGGSTA
jgi:NAD(P)-dependent dehydrogenase (short-subunit alcohol dehydrogenase family)